MTRIMRDSDKAPDIPLHGLDLAAGYANGPASQWSAADWERFTAAGIPTVRIDVLGTDPGGSGVLDVEPGDAGVATAVAWVQARRKIHPGDYCVIYANRSELTPLFNAMAAAGLHVARDFHLWIATGDGTKTVADMTGVVAVQYAWQDRTGGHWDESIVYDDAWHPAAAPAPKPAPAPPPAQAQYGYLVTAGGAGGLAGRAVVSHDAGRTWS